MSNYVFADLFAGCGGLSLGLKQAGFKHVFMNEIDPVCAKTYLTNLPLAEGSFFIGDICELNKKLDQYKNVLKSLDLVCGGPPCQGFSMANRQRLFNDPRNTLYREYLKFVAFTRPKFFIMENVKGMLNKIDEIIDDFRRTVGEDYDIAFKVLKAVDFGVPQTRERLIIIGNRIGVDSKKVFDDIATLKTKRFTLFDAISDLPALSPNRIKNDSARENEEIGFIERDFDYTNTPFYRFINNGRKVRKLYNHKNRYNNDRDIEIFSRLPQGENSLHKSIADIMPYKTRNGIFKDKYFKLKYAEPCKTITSHMKYDCNMYIHPVQSRGLSPREAARVQTFPDDFILTGPQNSWYHQVGNAVPVKLAEAIGRSILKWLSNI